MLLDSTVDSANHAVQVLNTPKISVGKGDAIINVLPPALRFWEKLGLGPKSGEKDATVYVLFEVDEEQHRQGEVASWLAGVCTAYQVWIVFLLENVLELMTVNRQSIWAN